MTDISNNPHTFAISEIGDDDVIIGLDWIKKINPIINWKQGYMCRKNKHSKITYRSTRIQNKQITNDKDRKSTRLNSSHSGETRMPSSA